MLLNTPMSAVQIDFLSVLVRLMMNRCMKFEVLKAVKTSTLFLRVVTPCGDTSV
jgi:hypothetical protein